MSNPGLSFIQGIANFTCSTVIGYQQVSDHNNIVGCLASIAGWKIVSTSLHKLLNVQCSQQ